MGCVRRMRVNRRWLEYQGPRFRAIWQNIRLSATRKVEQLIMLGVLTPDGQSIDWNERLAEVTYQHFFS